MTAQTPPRCNNCPMIVASNARPDMGLCHRYPKAEVIRDVHGHWCGEHPRLALKPPEPKPAGRAARAA